MRLGLVTAAVIVSAALSACTANDSAIFHTIDPVQTSAVDAKQRFLVVVDRKGERKFCAEPSPDALSAISSSFSTSLSGGIFGQGEGSGALGSALSEAVSQLGTRNATIQLLRDGFYRLCEGFLNNAASGTTYSLLATKYVDSMVTLLAIEQLTPANSKQLNTTSGKGSKATTKSSVGGATGGQANPAGSSTNTETTPPPAEAPNSPEPTRFAQTPFASRPILTLVSLPSLVPAASLAQNSETDGAASTPRPNDTTNGANSTAAPAGGDANKSDTGTNASGSATAGPPAVSVTVAQGNSGGPSTEVANTVAFIVGEYLQRARFNDCLLALDNLNIDLQTNSANEASSALIQTCAEVLHEQATFSTVPFEKLLETHGHSQGKEAPAKMGQ